LIPSFLPIRHGGGTWRSFAIGNQTQFDYGLYFQNPLPTTQFPNLNSGVNLRRERIFFVAKFDDWTLNVTPDFGGSPESLWVCRKA
jgi:phosphate-selective porin OprO/OprP